MKAELENKKNEVKYTPYNELTFDLPALEYDADADSIIPFEIKGKLIAHKIKAISDERYLQREREVANLSNNADVMKPTRDLWKSVVIERYNCVDRDDWKDKVSDEQILNTIAGYTYLTEDGDSLLETDEDTPLDDEEVYQLNFTAFYGGITKEQWQEWFISGHFPSNIALTETQYHQCLEYFKKGIAFRYYLPVSFEFSPTITDAQRREFILILSNKPKDTLVSGLKNKESITERSVSLYRDLCRNATGYKGRVPVWHQVVAVSRYLALKIEELGKSTQN